MNDLYYLFFIVFQRPLPTLSATVPSSNIVPQKSSHRWRMLSAQLGVAKNKVHYYIYV